jgi:hypothetical protein
MRIRVALIMTTLASVADAQLPVRFDCVRDRFESADSASLGAWATLRPSAVVKRLEGLRLSDHWSALADSLRSIYSTPPAALSGLAQPERDAIIAQLAALAADLKPGESGPAQRMSKAATDRFHLSMDLGPPLQFTLFDGIPPTQVSVGASTPDPTRRSVCWLAFAASDVVQLYNTPALAALSAALSRRTQRWDNFMNHGYSLLPLEMLVNGFYHRESLEPPSTQIILMHPSAGTQVVTTFKSLRDARREDVLALEPIGILGYDADRSQFGGVSLVATFPSSNGIGIGGMLHLSHLGHAAYIVRPKDDDGKRRGALLMSLDVYRYVSAAPDKWRELKDKAVKDCKAKPIDCLKQLKP